MKVFGNKELAEILLEILPLDCAQGQDFGSGLTPAKRLKLSKSVENSLVELR